LIICKIFSIFRLNFWDLGGQEELQALWDKYYAECHGVIYTVDSNDRDRVEESKKSFDQVTLKLKSTSIMIILDLLKGCNFKMKATVINTLQIFEVLLPDSFEVCNKA